MVALLTFGTGVKNADIPEAIKKQAHSEKECGVHVVKNRNTKDILRLAKEPDFAKILVLQAQPEEIGEEHLAVLTDWIENHGGTLWFYDSRFAPALGMQPAPINPETNLSRKTTGEYGSVKKHPGIAAVASAAGSHPVLSGVTGAAIFILEVGEDQYSAVRTGGDVQPLLKLDLTDDIAVAAIREAGKGKIILKPLLWPDQLTGGRFQVNILEYSAGFPVPQITASESPVSDELLRESPEFLELRLVDMVQLSDGRTVFGKVLNENVDFEGTSRSRAYATKDLESLETGAAALDKLTTLKGETLKGYVIIKDGFLFMTPSGKKVTLPKSDIVKIRFNIDKEADSSGVFDTESNRK